MDEFELEAAEESERYANMLPAGHVPLHQRARSFATGTAPARKAASAGIDFGPDNTFDNYAGQDAYLTFARQVAETTGHSLDDIFELAQDTALGNDDESKAEAILALSEVLGAVNEDGEFLSLSALTAAERRSASGHALPGGHFPIPDEKHLHLAVGEFHAGNLAGQDAAKVKAHILSRAKALGIKVDLGNGDGPGRGDKTKLKTYPKSKHNGTDGADSFGSGGGETGGPSGSGSGGGMSMAARALVSQARAGGGYSRGDVLRLAASREADPEQEDLFLLAANIADLEDDQHRSAEESELVRLSREHPGYFGLDEAVQLSGKVNAERNVAGEVESLAERHPDYLLDRHDVKKKGKRHPVGKVTSRTRAHAPENCSTDPHEEIQRYLRLQQADSKVNTQSPHGQHSSDGGPKPYRPPGPSGKPQTGYGH